MCVFINNGPRDNRESFLQVFAGRQGQQVAALEQHELGGGFEEVAGFCRNRAVCYSLH